MSDTDTHVSRIEERLGRIGPGVLGGYAVPDWAGRVWRLEQEVERLNRDLDRLIACFTGKKVP